ncbi:MAG: hypothetical protein AAGB02_06325 [Pseudomonadota bacterium]
MSEQLHQIALDLPARPVRFDAATYIVTDANRNAYDTALAWLRSDDAAIAISGGSGSGKTHLGYVLAERAGGKVLTNPGDLNVASVNEPVLIVDNLPGELTGRELLAGLNSAMTKGKRLALFGVGEPANWAGGLRDLETRLAAMPHAEIGQPDEELLRLVMLKRFRDRQIAIEPRVIDYAAPRIARTFAAARIFVERVDRLALESKRPVTIALARKTVEALSDDQQPV